jgi:hypothetical protein
MIMTIAVYQSQQNAKFISNNVSKNTCFVLKTTTLPINYLRSPILVLSIAVELLSNIYDEMNLKNFVTHYI